MSNSLVIDSFEMAKEYQWQIDSMDDPVEAALEASKALSTLNLIKDERMRDGVPVIVQALGAYSLRLWDEDEERYVTRQYSPLRATGNSAGIGFVQNMSSAFRLQTIFVGIRNSQIVESVGESGDKFTRVSEQLVPRLVIPVLDLELIEKAA